MHNIPALILVRSGRMRDGLVALLNAAPQIGIIGRIEKGPVALKMIPPGYPALVVLEAGLPDGEAWTTLQQLKANRPQTRCIMLVDNSTQQQMAREAGADGVLLSGFSAAHLFTTLEKLLPYPEESISSPAQL